MEMLKHFSIKFQIEDLQEREAWGLVHVRKHSKMIKMIKTFI